MLNRLALLTIFGFANCLAMAQKLCADPPALKQPVGQNMVTQFKGALKGFQRGILTVTRDDGSEVMVRLPEDASAFQFVATAKPAFLQRGAMVRFAGTFSSAGVHQPPAVERVEVFQPISGKVPGSAREKYIPDVYPPRADRNKPPKPIAKYDVVGALMGLDASGVMLVQAGKRQVRVQLSPDAKFEIRFNTLSLAQEGDPVSVSGFYQPPDETNVLADRVTISTDRVYGDPSNASPKRASRRRSRRTQQPETEREGGAERAAEGDGPAPAKEAP